MKYYEYRQWLAWPENEIHQYSQSIATAHSLTANQSEYLERRMSQKAGYWPKIRDKYGPLKMDAKMETLYRSLCPSDNEVFQENCRLNRPYNEPKLHFKGHWVTVGSGLTRKQKLEIERESTYLRNSRRRAQRQNAKHPFISMIVNVRQLATEAMWEANCYPIEEDVWLTPPNVDTPHEGLAWYSGEITREYYNARDQHDLGNTEYALWHAFKAGILYSELKLRMNHGLIFDKYEAVNSAQRNASLSRKVISDEARREAYWRHRRAGNKRIESGRLAADELGLSETSIRNAFPNKKYPTE